MKIRSLETFTRGHASIVRLRTDDGAESYGQISPYNADIAAAVFHRQVAPHALGAPAEEIDALVDRIVEREYKFPGSYVRRALAGLDTALWDLRGRLAGKSVCRLLGGSATHVPAYGSSMRRDIGPADEADRLARLRDRDGYRAFKVRIGKVCGHDEDQWPGRTETLIPAVRRALGDDVAFLADANSCYTPARAIEVGRTLQDHAAACFEEPCPYWEVGWTAEVAAALEMDVSGGEQDCLLSQWRRIVETRAVDVVQPDVCYIGGLTRALRVAAMADEAGLRCVPHSANLSMVSVFALHLLGAIPNAWDFMEFSIEPPGWAGEIFDPPLRVVDGSVEVPDAPGWGVVVRPAWLQAAERRASELD